MSGSRTNAVIFDLDGLLLESEQVWNAAKRRLTRERGGRWTPEAEHAMLGMSSREWARYMRDELGVPLAADELSGQVVRIMVELYGDELPLIPGAGEALARLSKSWPLGLASSSNREIIDLVLNRTGWAALIEASVASEEVAKGKPAPDVYLEAARRLGVAPERCVSVEDSGPGILSARAAGMGVIAVPNADFPPGAGELARAHLILESLADLDRDAVARAAAASAG